MGKKLFLSSQSEVLQLQGERNGSDAASESGSDGGITISLTLLSRFCLAFQVQTLLFFFMFLSEGFAVAGS